MEYLDTYDEHVVSDDTLTAPVVYLDGEPQSPQLAEWNIDSDKVASNVAYLKNFDQATVDDRMITIASILKTAGSPLAAHEVVNAFPVVLATRSEKLRALAGILNGSVDRDYIASLDAKGIASYVTPPIDAALAAVAMQKIRPWFAPKGITRQHVVEMQKSIPPQERRFHSLELLSSEFDRKLIGNHAIRAYLAYSPITFAEFKVFPELSSVIMDNGDAILDEQNRLKDNKLHLTIDGSWMSRLAGYELDEQDIERANNLLAIGSLSIERNNTDDIWVEKIKDARRMFLEDIMVWNYKNHPLHDMYTSLCKSGNECKNLANFVQSQRLLSTYGIDLVDFAKITSGRSFQVRAESLERKIACLEELQLDVKHTMESAPIVLRMSVERLQQVHAEINSTAGLDAGEVLQRHPLLLARDPADLRQRLDYFTSLGVDLAALDLLRFGFGTKEKEKKIDERIESLEALGFDPAKVINKLPQLLTIDAQLLRRRFTATGAILRGIGSPIDPVAALTEDPTPLTRAADKMLATAGVLAGSVDPGHAATLQPRQLQPYLANSIDTMFAAVIDGKLQPRGRGVTSADFKRISRHIPAAKRRNYILGHISDPEVRAMLDAQALQVYLDYQPLTEKELTEYPQLADFVYI